MNKIPFVLIFDIDHAIIGNVGHCIKERNILDMIYEECKKKNITLECDTNNLNFEEELKEGLLRPGFKDFIDFCEEKYRNVEVFVYTNSTHDWTNRGLIKNIEKASNVKINKPYFTREYSSRRKRISFVYNDIISQLVKKYPSIKNQKNAEKIFKDRLLIIDDIPGNYDLNTRQIVCPMYEYSSYYDIIHKLKNKYKINDEILNSAKILNYCHQNDIPFYNIKGNKYQQDELYISSLHTLNVYWARINNDIKDTFFEDLIKILKSKKVLSDKIIKNINTKFE